MAAPKTKTPAQRLALRAQIMELLAQGIAHGDIAKRLGVDPSTITYWARQIKEHEQALLEDRTEMRRALLAELDEVKAEAWEAWQASRRIAKTVIEEETSTPQGNSTKTQVRKVSQVGDPAFLAQVQAAITQQRALAGLDMPKAEAQSQNILRVVFEDLPVSTLQNDEE